MTDHKEMKPCKPDYSGSDWAENVGLRAQLSVFSVFLCVVLSHHMNVSILCLTVVSERV